MAPVNYLNVGCGGKFHRAWTNVDMVAKDPAVRAVNLIQGIPFPADSFQVVYHSQVLEHIPRDRAASFLAECLRVLKPGGILRVVVPDLEELAGTYLRLLQLNLAQPSARAQADYDWVMLELLDQMVRDRSGGEMGRWLAQPDRPNQDFVVARVGRVARDALNRSLSGAVQQPRSVAARLRAITARKVVGWLRARWHARFDSDAARLGRFRLGGEVHLWMYDRFSLGRLLAQVGFTDITRMTPHTSAVADWQRWELDVRDGEVVDPTSLFMEARKPAH